MDQLSCIISELIITITISPNVIDASADSFFTNSVQLQSDREIGELAVIGHP